MATILFVDDNETNRRLFARVLARDGHDVYTAPDGRTALDALDRHAADVVLLDLMMPGMDGFQFLKALRSDPDRRGVPVVIYSALSDAETKSRAMALGAAAYAVKAQVRIEELLALVSRHARPHPHDDGDPSGGASCTFT